MFPKQQLLLVSLFAFLISVSSFAGTNPFLDTADTIVICPTDGRQLSTFTLCGASDFRSVQVNDPMVQSVTWQLLIGNSCPPVGDDCPNLGVSCSWNTVSTANTFIVDNVGDYRVVLTYESAPDEIFHARSFQNTYSDVISVTKDISVNGGSDGEITIETTGNGPFIYQISNDGGFTYGPFQNSPVFENLIAGNYQIKTRDSSGICEFISNPVVLLEPEVLVGRLVNTKVPTCIEGGEIIANASGGIPPYQYALDGGPFTSNNVFSNMPVGSYRVEVRDANGASSFTNGITITDSLPITPIFTVHNVTCSGMQDGRIEVEAFGGAGVYQYTLSIAGFAASAPQTSNLFQNLAPGIYDITVSDSGGCITSLPTIAITEPSPMVVTTAITNPSGTNSSDGSIILTTEGGAGGYQYAISPSLNAFQTSNIFSGLSAGSYTVLAQDENGCTQTMQVEITAPNPTIISFANVTRHVGCSASGIIEVNVSGGTPPYDFSLDGITYFTSTDASWSFEVFSSGSYTFIVRDSNGNTSDNSILVNETSELSIDVINTKDVSCNGMQNGSIEAVVQGGDGNYLFKLLDAFGNVLKDTQIYGVFENLSAGEYVIEVADSSGCKSTSFVYGIREAEVFSLVEVNAARVTDSFIGGGISFQIAGGAAPYSYSLNSGTFTNFDEQVYSITDLTAGDYLVTLRDVYGCEISFSQTVEASDDTSPVEVFQNPGRTQSLNMVWEMPLTSITTLVIYNTKGNVVFDLTYKEGTVQANIDVDSLSRGIYFVYIKNSEMEEVKKVLIQ